MTNEDNTWYVCIQKFGGRHYAFSGAGSNHYESYAGVARRSGVEIVTEQFGVHHDKMNRISGFGVFGKRTGENPLGDLVNKLNLGQIPDPHEALRALVGG